MDEQYIIGKDEPDAAEVEKLGSPSGETPQSIIAGLDAHPDETLRDLIGRAKALLAARQSERQERALATIKKLARENGLVVQAGKPGRKRGRPRKAIDGS